MKRFAFGMYIQYVKKKSSIWYIDDQYYIEKYRNLKNRKFTKSFYFFKSKPILDLELTLTTLYSQLGRNITIIDIFHFCSDHISNMFKTTFLITSLFLLPKMFADKLKFFLVHYRRQLRKQKLVYLYSYTKNQKQTFVFKLKMKNQT